MESDMDILFFANTYQRRITDGIATGETVEDVLSGVVRKFEEENKEKVNWKKEGF